MENHNPYAAPKAALNTPQTDNDEFALLPEPRKVGVGAGWRWVTDAWSFFKAQPLLWLAITVAFLVIIMVLSVLPVVGILAGFLATFFIAGMVIGCDAQIRGEGLSFAHLFAGFQKNPMELLILSVLYLVGSIVAFIPGFLIIGSAFIPLVMGNGDPSSLAQNASILTMLLGFLVIMAIYFIVLMAYWFAPALVTLNDVKAIEAMKLSFKACLKNIIPFFVFGLLVFILAILATIPLLLGWFILFPVLMITYYTSYRHVLTVDK